MTSLLLDVRDAASLCGLSRSGWYKLVSVGKAPRPVKIGRLVRWRRGELEAWVQAGCPSREKWDTIWTDK